MGHICSLLFCGLPWLRVEAALQHQSVSSGKTLGKMPEMTRLSHVAKVFYCVSYHPRVLIFYRLICIFTVRTDISGLMYIWWPVYIWGCCWWRSEVVSHFWDSFQIMSVLQKKAHKGITWLYGLLLLQPFLELQIKLV